MPLSPADVAKIRKLAAENGWDLNELLELGAGIADDAEKNGKKPAPEKDPEPKGDDAAKKGAAQGEAKIFQYHLPFLKAREVRESIGHPGDDMPEPDLFAGQWLAKYGGALAPGGSKGGSTPPDEE